MKKFKRYFYFQLITLFIVNVICESVWAHQPVMDMAPRWKGGYGFQIRQELRFSDTLLDGGNEIDNPLGRKKLVNTTWLEGNCIQPLCHLSKICKSGVFNGYKNLI